MAYTPGASTEYALPYEVLLPAPPLLSTGRKVRLRVRPEGKVEPSAVESLDSLVTAFFMLASSKALGGSMVKPWKSGIGDRGPAVVVEGGIEWQLDECWLDERAASILAQLFLSSHEAHPLKSVLLMRQMDGHPLLPLPRLKAGVADSPYPERWGRLPFALDMQEEVEDSVDIAVTFHQPLEQGQVSMVEAPLLTWAAAASMGAYAIAPSPPERCSLSAAEGVDVDDEQLYWNLSDFRAHPAAIDGLLNVLVALDHDVARIAEVSIS